LFAVGVIAKGQDLSQVAMEGGGDALTLVLGTQFNAVNQGAEHLGRLGPDVGVVQRLFELLDLFRVDFGQPRMKANGRWGSLAGVTLAKRSWMLNMSALPPEADILNVGDIVLSFRQTSPGAERCAEAGRVRGRGSCRLFRHSHEQSAGQFAVCTNHGRILGVVVLAKKVAGPE